jgi:hypothetical protein
VALIGPHPPMALEAPTPPALPAPDGAVPPAAAPAGGSEGKWQPPGWAPPLGAVQYVKETVTALLLVLALPYVFWKLLTNPAWLFNRAGRKHVEP